MSREEGCDKARDLIAPVLGTEVCSKLIGKLLASGNSARCPRAAAGPSKELIESMLAPTVTEAATTLERKKPFYYRPFVQVLAGVAIAIALGYVSPATAVAMKPLGDLSSA